MTRLRSRAALITAAVAAAGLAVAVPSPAGAATTGFTAGDLVVFRVGTGAAALSSAATPAFLDEFSQAGSAVQSVALPTTPTGANKRLTSSGTGTSEGELNLSTDGRYLVAAGYNAAVGTSSPGGATASSVPRTVALVAADDTVDTTTSLTDALNVNNVRGATSQDGSGVYVAGADSTTPTPGSGIRYAVRGASTSTPLTSSTYPNFRDAVIAGGQLYASADPTKTGAVTVATIGTGLPTTGTNAVTNLPFSSAPASPYAFAFLTLGTGSSTTPDTLYVADNSAGVVSKYALVSGTWTRRGSVTLSGVTGVTANDVNGVAQVFATTASGLYSLSDSSGAGGTLSGSAAKIAAPAANTAFRGVAFAPGTVIGSGPGAPPVVPTITVAHTGLPAALGDPTNATDAVTVTDDAYPASRLTVTAASSNQQVAADSGISVTGTGASRTLTVTPGAVGTATITVTVTAPDGQTATTTVSYAVSADLGDPSDRYYSGAGNASAAIDVGDGYVVVGDDESDVLRLYDSSRSGPPVAMYDLTAQLPFKTAEVDIEGAARVGDTIYWTGSMSNNSKGQVAPARSTVFATTVSGTGAATTLSYAGAYTGLQADLVTWDDSNGHGLGARYLGFDDSVNGGIANHATNSFNVEGLEFSSTDPSTAYLAFRGPLEPTTDRHLALVVPVTNLPALVSGTASSATFGAPLFWDLGGLGIRDIRRNADGSYLVLAGTATDANDSFVLYTWDGDPADPPLPGQTLPVVPGGGNQGSWEAVVATPDPLSDGATVRLIEDNGTTAWYGDGNTSKSGLPVDLQKDLSRSFAYTTPSKFTTTTMLAASATDVPAGSQVTYTATVGSTTGVPRGTVSFSDDDGVVDGCAGQLVSADGTATCVVTYPHAGTHQVTATYSGASAYAGSSSAPVTLTVEPVATTTTLDSDNPHLVTGQPVTLTATVTPSGAGGTVSFSADGAVLDGCAAVPVDASGQAQCVVTGGFHPSNPTIVAAYSGDTDHTPSASAGLTEAVTRAATQVAVTADPVQPQPGHELTLTAAVTAVAPGSGTPTGTATFTVTGPQGTRVDCTGGDQQALTDGAASCVIPGAQIRGGADYNAEVAYSGDDEFADSTGSLDATAAQADSTTTVSTSADPTPGSKAVTLRAVVARTGQTGSAPTGTVTFTITGTSGDTVACNGKNTVGLTSGPGTGVAKCVLARGSLSAIDAPYQVSAAYSGDSQYTPSAGKIQQRVTTTDTRITVVQSAKKTAPGEPVTFTATVTAVGSGTGTPTGDLTITVTDAAGASVTCTPGSSQESPRQETCTVAAGVLTRAGSPYTVTATYAGDAGFTPSTAKVKHKV